MKIRLVVALVGLAIGFALPTFAQQKDTVDRQIAEQIRALAAKYDEVFIGTTRCRRRALHGGRGLGDAARNIFRSAGNRKRLCKTRRSSNTFATTMSLRSIR